MNHRFRFKIAFFDFDGVILESEGPKNDAMLRFFRRFPQDISSQIISYHNQFKTKSRYEKLEYLFNILMPFPISEDKQAELSNELNKSLLRAVGNAPEVLGARQLLRRMKGVVPIILVSTTPIDALQQTLELRRMGEYFDEVHGTPPAKHVVIQEVLTRRKMRVENAFLVGDGSSDQTAAEKAGIAFVGRKSSRDTLFTKNSLDVIDDLSELERKLIFCEKYIVVDSNRQGGR